MSAQVAWRCDGGVHCDVRVGGKYRDAMQQGGDEPIVFYGEYLEIEPPKRLVCTQIFAPFPDAPVVVTVTFEDRGHETKLTSQEPRGRSLEAPARVAASVGLRRATRSRSWR